MGNESCDLMSKCGFKFARWFSEADEFEVSLGRYLCVRTTQSLRAGVSSFEVCCSLVCLPCSEPCCINCMLRQKTKC